MGETRGTALRKNWVKFGAIVYLGSSSPASSKPASAGTSDAALHELELVGIYTCEHQRTFLPGDSGWGHAKAIFRMSLMISVTLKDHLAILHWVRANGFSLAVRETLPPKHPVRRLTKPHIYKTASINWDSQALLMRVDSLAYRAAAFTPDSWTEFFTDALKMEIQDLSRGNAQPRTPLRCAGANATISGWHACVGCHTRPRGTRDPLPLPCR